MQPSSLLMAFVALAVVLGLIWLVQRVAQGRLAPMLRAGGGGAVAVTQTVALDSRRRLHLVRCEGRQVLLLTGGAQDVVVGWLPAEGGA